MIQSACHGTILSIVQFLLALMLLFKFRCDYEKNNIFNVVSNCDWIHFMQ